MEWFAYRDGASASNGQSRQNRAWRHPLDVRALIMIAVGGHGMHDAALDQSSTWRGVIIARWGMTGARSLVRYDRDDMEIAVTHGFGETPT